MWLISSEGKALNEKRLWLRPSSSYLFGRTSGKGPNGERVNYIEDGGVSRRHLSVTIGDIHAGDSGRVLAKSGVTFTDGSKSGTTVNGVEIKGESKMLDGGKFRIKLGKTEIYLNLEWHPVTLSFTGIGSKAAKAKGIALATEKSKLETMDVKLVTDYLTNQTTHVIAKKRNTAAGLQALLQAKWVLHPSYVDALAAAGKRDGNDENGSPRLSPLELDFDANWPAEDGHICPPGAEPVPRPEEWLKPKPERAEVFHNFSFIFLDQPQYDQFMPIVTSGSGKALCYEFKRDETTAEDVIGYIREVAGKKNSRHFLLSQEPAPCGIIIVRPAENHPVRTENVLSEIDLALNQRSVEQSEFLDAILSVDASSLRTALPPAPESAQVEPKMSTPAALQPATRSQAREEQQNAAPDSSPIGRPPRSTRDATPTQSEPGQEDDTAAPAAGQPAPASKRKRPIITKKAFKGFDDWDESQVLPAPSKRPHSHQPSQAETKNSNMDVDEPSQLASHTQRKSQKRPAPIAEEEESEEQMMNRIMPGQAAMKRRRTEAMRNGNKSFWESTPAPEQSTAPTDKDAKSKGKGKSKKESEAELKAKIIARREAEEAKRQKENEDLRQAGVDPKDVPEAAIETFELPMRPPRAVRTETGEGRGDNWDPKWNGRPNFKKFRPKGSTDSQGRDFQRHTPRVLIALEEIPGKGHGLGDEYWLETGDVHEKHRKKGKSQSQSQSQSQSSHTLPASSTNNVSQPRGENDEEERTAFRRRLERSREEDADDAAADGFNPGAQKGFRSQSALGTDTLKKAAGKRPATTQLSGPAKKARQSTTSSRLRRTIDVSDEDDDPRAFRRKRG